MSLFMPTNITPDYLGSLGNGIVPPTVPLSVSWQVNGNSPMVAFKIDLYDNTSNSQLQYTTGKITDGCPFYGTDSLGNPQLFSYEIDDSELLILYEDYTEWKLVITQWWSENDYVVQASPSAFTVKAAPTITLPVSTVSTREATFTATYSQADGDALNWVRWQIAYNSETGKANPFYDSGNIYNTALLQTTYDGFFSGTMYAIKCMIETQSGVTADTGWVAFQCYYNTQSLTGTVEAAKACGKSAVRVEWNGFRYISGRATGDYSIEDGILALENGASVTWDEVNGSPMTFNTPWTLLYKGTLQSADATLFSLTLGENVISAVYSNANRRITFSENGTSKRTVSTLSATSTLWIVIRGGTIYYHIDYMSGGLYPSETLYPSNTLYPRDDDTPSSWEGYETFSYTQAAITSVTLGGAQECDFVQIIEAAASDPDLRTAMTAMMDGTYTPTPINGTVFLADYVNDLNAGTLYISGTEIDGWAIYRNDENNNFMHIANVPMEQSSILDYSARSQQGDYTYYVYPIGTDTYITQPMVSNGVNPKFWDWSILECTLSDDGIFELVREFRFNKNLSTNSMSNNNAPGIFKNFTRYPTVQLSNQNYHSSSFTALIGDITLTDGTLKYYDTLATRDAIESLSTTLNHLFLKNRKGDLMEIRLAGEVSFETADNSPTQALSVTIPWVEIGDASKASIVAEGE